MSPRPWAVPDVSLDWWFPPPRDMDTGHRVSPRYGERPMRSRDLPGLVALAPMPWWERGRSRLVFWAAELAMRAAAREMGRLPARCQDQLETDPEAVTW